MDTRMDTIKIGWGQRSITPTKPVLLAGQFHDRVADQVRDPVLVTAMAIEGGSADGKQGDHVVWVSCDLIGIENEIQVGVREKVRNAVSGLDPELVILNATHTHTAPGLNGFNEKRIRPYLTAHKNYPHIMSSGEYSEFIIEQIAEAVQEAWLGRQPGALSWAEGYAALGHNRMVKFDDESVVMYGDVRSVSFQGFSGPEDHRVEMMFTWDANRALTGVMLNLACPAQIIEHESFISADYFAEVRDMVGQKWGSNVRVLGLIGAAGDQAPRDLMRNRGRVKLEGDEELRAAAKVLVRTMEEGLESTGQDLDTHPIFKHQVRTIALPLRRVGKAEADQARSVWREFKDEYEQQQDPIAFGDSLGMRIFEVYNAWAIQNQMIKLEQDPFYQMELHVLRIGDAVVVTNPFELFTEYGLQIKARSAAKQTFISQLTSGYRGYLPSASAIKHGGYGTQMLSGDVGDEGGKLLVEHTLHAINSMWQLN
ncbi:hypothetical protein [Paenibacillus eucommiae]|uniref:Neutral/alkaline non-lysosomal ceramidase N-terminal domain-containing protein n=1 Tax=Paenibacillus eucommiae TaxID=1355755 RepID=A0ABS4IRY9_9BACL|nr:hypothetical protein [Paenibacillus eucommiae]MBP1990337.1 hypothetical protein [Paenibacillus eucommiae]